MSDEATGLIIGGVIPAFLFAGYAIFSKLTARYELPLWASIIAIGVAVIVVGIGASFFPDEGNKVSWQGLGNAFLSGTCFGIGAVLVYVSLKHFNASISVITPLYNTNSIIAALVGYFLLSEWTRVNPTYLAIALFLFTVGGVILTRA